MWSLALNYVDHLGTKGKVTLLVDVSIYSNAT